MKRTFQVLQNRINRKNIDFLLLLKKNKKIRKIIKTNEIKSDNLYRIVVPTKKKTFDQTKMNI